MESKGGTFSWYNSSGPDEDVILSTRVRVVRNLADFKFPSKSSEDDKRRIFSLCEDAFSFDENFQVLKASDISKAGIQALRDNTMIGNYNFQGVAINTKESIICLINELNHLKIINYDSGFDCERIMKNVYKIDESLQKKLQFAASYDFGYLTSKLGDCGTGLKISLRVFIPSIIISGHFTEFQKEIFGKGCTIRPIVKPTDVTDFSNYIFDIFATDCQTGTELDQLAQIQAIGEHILKSERKIRKHFADNNPTVVLNFVKTRYAKLINAMLLTYEEGLNGVGALKWGIQTGVLAGISEAKLNELMYSTKDIHLQLINDNYPFTYEDDIKNSLELVIQRLRTIVIQQSIQDITL